ncbi:MAG: hypothetical protein N2039_11300, partial [Gemmataceae bacterium]|nr:hypothetical protein [Gemmataceae bacterium]
NGMARIRSGQGFTLDEGDAANWGGNASAWRDSTTNDREAILFGTSISVQANPRMPSGACDGDRGQDRHAPPELLPPVDAAVDELPWVESGVVASGSSSILAAWLDEAGD